MHSHSPPALLQAGRGVGCGGQRERHFLALPVLAVWSAGHEMAGSNGGLSL